MEWEDIDFYHKRTKVFGGWLVKAYEDVFRESNYSRNQYGKDWRIAMCFVPDPNHEWKIGESNE